MHDREEAFPFFLPSLLLRTNDKENAPVWRGASSALAKEETEVRENVQRL